MVNWHPLGTIWHPLEGPGTSSGVFLEISYEYLAVSNVVCCHDCAVYYILGAPSWLIDMFQTGWNYQPVLIDIRLCKKPSLLQSCQIGNGFDAGVSWSKRPIPDALYMDYLPTLSGKWLHFIAFGYGLLQKKHPDNVRTKGFRWICHKQKTAIYMNLPTFIRYIYINGFYCIHHLCSVNYRSFYGISKSKCPCHELLKPTLSALRLDSMKFQLTGSGPVRPLGRVGRTAHV